MITANQLLAHAVGDYLLQSDWAANAKTKEHRAAAAHVATYMLPFLLFRPSARAFLIIAATHFLIDRYRLARQVCWLKNCLGPHRPWSECQATGYPPERPVWLSVWLLIIADNILHVVINGLALRYLPRATTTQEAT